jgi:exodeoxyribonuclease III
VTGRLRVVSWNIENLLPALRLPVDSAPPKKRGKPLRKKLATELSEMAERLGRPDVLCLQEVRVRPQDTDVVSAMREALPGYTCHFALADDARNASFRGGRAYGVASYVRQELASVAVPRPEWDREGRVIAVELPEHALTLINVYAVNGSEKPHFDHGLERIEGDRHGFKRRFQADLLQYALSLRHVERELVLIGDFNISRAAADTHPRLRSELPHAMARAMFNDTFMPALDVLDAFRELHPDEARYTWFSRLAPEGVLDAARVDFALVARSLMPRVREAVILDEPYMRSHSDHAPIRLVLEVS